MRTTCPHCLSYRLRPEPYRWYERFLAWVWIHPFRCLCCGLRFLRSSGVPSSSRQVLLG